MLHPLGSSDQSRIQHLVLEVLLHNLGAFFDQAFHPYALFPSGIFVKHFEDSFESSCLFLGLLQVLLKAFAQFL